MTTNLLRADEANIDTIASEAAKIIKAGGVIAFPTDTVYGVAVKYNDINALERLYRAKDRDRGKPIPILISSMEVLAREGFMCTSRERILMDRFWPGPLTLILKKNGQDEGVRFPSHRICLAVLSCCGGILRVTSANQSGEPPALSADMAMTALSGKVDLIIDGGLSDSGLPSTVLKCSDTGFDIFREGAISRASVSEALGEL